MKESMAQHLYERVLAWLDGELEQNEIQRLDQELQACSEKRRLFQQLAALHSALEEQGRSKAELQ